MGMKGAAISLLCQDSRVFDAMSNSGTPCPYKGKIGKEAKKEWEKNLKEAPKGNHTFKNKRDTSLQSEAGKNSENPVDILQYKYADDD